MNMKKSSLKHQIAEEIRKVIFRGDLNPGDKVTETKLARELDVSRGPVREAVQLLVMEGLLVSITFKETRVSQITTEEVTDLLIPMRINMETFALRKAYPLWDQGSFARFEEILEEMRRATMYADLPYFNELDLQFHEYIIQSSNMSNVSNLWQGISNRIRLHFSYQNQLSQDMQKFLNDHRTLFNSFKSGSIDNAIQSLKEHLIETNTPPAQLLPDENDI